MARERRQPDDIHAAEAPPAGRDLPAPADHPPVEVESSSDARPPVPPPPLGHTYRSMQGITGSESAVPPPPGNPRVAGPPVGPAPPPGIGPAHPAFSPPQPPGFAPGGGGPRPGPLAHFPPPRAQAMIPPPHLPPAPAPPIRPPEAALPSPPTHTRPHTSRPTRTEAEE